MSINIKNKIVAELVKLCDIDADLLNSYIEIPPQSELGDYALPCFKLAKTMRKAPPAIAAEFVEGLAGKLPEIAEIKQTGGYLNFFMDRTNYIKDTVVNLLNQPNSVISSSDFHDKTVLVEFSSPNIAKPFHVGHAFTTILGQALANMYKYAGYNVVKLNHLGDYGTQFGKLIVAYELWGNEEELKANPIQELLRIYVHFHKAAKEDESLEVRAREAFKRLENGQEYELNLWQKFRDLSLVEFKQVYDRLGVEFDNYNGESFYSDKIPAVVDMLRNKGLLVESDGAQVVELDELKLPPCIILKSDGTTIYASRDLAAILYREKTWNFYKNLYVVGIPQALHFRQVFSVLDKAGYDCAKRCEHIGFGLVKFPDGKMSTREGEVIFLQDLLSEAVNKTFEIIKKNAQDRYDDMDVEEQKAIAEKVGLGAVIYTFLRNGRERDIVFSWDEMLNFEGDTAPYLQYTYARAHSLLRRAGVLDKVNKLSEAVNKNVLRHDSEFNLCRQIEALETAFNNALKNNEPSILAKQISSVAHAFNKFYTDCPIFKEEGDLQSARLALVMITCSTLKIALNLLNIDVVERM